MSRTVKLTLALAAYVLSIIAANAMSAHLGMLPVGLGLAVSAGTYAAGFALVARDLVHRTGGAPWALAGIAVGCILSLALASPALALASAVAFGGAELVDLLVFSLTKERLSLAASILISNTIAAPLDTVIFLHLAGFPLTWPNVLGQFVGKVFWATVIPLILFLVAKRAARRA